MLKDLQANTPHSPLSDAAEYGIANLAEHNHGEPCKAIGQHQPKGNNDGR